MLQQTSFQLEKVKSSPIWVTLVHATAFLVPLPSVQQVR